MEGNFSVAIRHWSCVSSTWSCREWPAIMEMMTRISRNWRSDSNSFGDPSLPSRATPHRVLSPTFHKLYFSRYDDCPRLTVFLRNDALILFALPTAKYIWPRFGPLTAPWAQHSAFQDLAAPVSPHPRQYPDAWLSPRSGEALPKWSGHYVEQSPPRLEIVSFSLLVSHA